MKNSSIQEEYDAIVVGSGCTGGTAAMVLAEQGLTVLVIEAGKNITPELALSNPSSVTSHLKRLWRAFVSKSHNIQSNHPSFWKYDPDLFTNEKKNPYSYPENKDFVWIRGRQLGGRSHTWGGVATRWSKHEFAIPERDGFGKWPLSHEELVPYYERVEIALRVRGTRYDLPHFSNPILEPGPNFTPAEETFKELVNARWPNRHVVLSSGMHQEPVIGGGNPWPARSSLGTTLALALATGRVTVITDRAVRNVEFDVRTKKATGISAVNCITGDTEKYRSRSVVLCASAFESVRILLNSAGSAHPDGPGNESGLLGRCIMDHIAPHRHFSFPFTGTDASIVYPAGGPHSIWIPRWVNLETQDCEFKGGIGIWGGIQRDFRPVNRTGYSAGMLQAICEMMPHPDNRIELDNGKVDAWGIPTLKITCELRENDLRIQNRGSRILDEILAATGSKIREVSFFNPVATAMAARASKSSASPGYYIHEVGGARMGASPQDSVVNSFCQVWGSQNLLVTDGACWPTIGWQSPTLTMMAISARACSHMAEELK